MMDQSTVEQILDWIGTEQDGEDLDATYVRCGTVEAAALSILRRRRAVLGPQKWSLSGDYSQDDAGQTAAWLDDQIRRLAELTGEPDPSMMTVGTITRDQPQR